MKTIISGIIALIIPVFLLAQTAKDPPDLSQIQKKINKLENENTRLKTQLNGMQKTLKTMSEAEVAELLVFTKYDLLIKANQDTVKSYSGRLLKGEEDNAEIEQALMWRTLGFLVVLVLLILLIAIRWFTHRGTHRANMDELLEKMKAQREEREQRLSELKAVLEQSMKAQREEREKRIAEIRAMLDQSANELAALKKETGDRLAMMNENLAHADHNLQSLLASKITELGQKVEDSGKKLDDQISAAHKKTDELKTVLAREIEAIRSKFE